jgi:hypothetical protein
LPPQAAQLPLLSETPVVVADAAAITSATLAGTHSAKEANDAVHRFALQGF